MKVKEGKMDVRGLFIPMLAGVRIALYPSFARLSKHEQYNLRMKRTRNIISIVVIVTVIITAGQRYQNCG